MYPGTVDSIFVLPGNGKECSYNIRLYHYAYVHLAYFALFLKNLHEIRSMTEYAESYALYIGQKFFLVMLWAVSAQTAPRKAVDLVLS